ncbi:Chondroitinase-AC precursor [compost metagenome]
MEGSVSASFGVVKKGDVVNTNVPSASWVQHNGVTYYFPKQTNLVVSTQTQNGNWNKINQTYGKENIAGDVFKLWIDHGTKPDTASYQYVVLPAIKNIKSFDPKTIELISNTPQHQSVYHQQLKIFQAVFYNPSVITTAMYEITVNKPCVLMLKEGKGNEKILYVADPLQQESVISLQLKNIKTGKSISIDVQLPEGPLKGATKEVKVSF